MGNQCGTSQHSGTTSFCKGTPIHLVLVIQANVTQLAGMESDDKFPQEHGEALLTL